MSVLKKCCVCDGNIVEGRCEKCGMPYQENRSFYHLNENRRDHVEHMSDKDKQEYARQQAGYGQRPPVRPASGPQQYGGQNGSGGMSGQNRPGGAPGQRGGGYPPRQEAKNSLIGIIIFIIIILFMVGPLLLNFIAR